ncbi:MAG: hypothetical protein HY465_04625, partial [Deltaproteobacteria bacterium]|nr:hypothetical protein [Deltaproteobacteria bacterium]
MNTKRWLKVSAITLALTLGVSAKLFAQQFELPIPMASDENQVGAGNSAIRTQATHLDFCDQPQPGMPGALNFTGDGIDLEGQHYLLRDICAVPGLKREDPVPLNDIRSFALDNMGMRGAIGTLEPLDGFCPETLSLTVPGGIISMTIDCRLGKNKESRQSDVCDVRSEAVVDEEETLLADLAPSILVGGTIGSCQESVSPYTVARYPITVKSNEAVTELALPFPPGVLTFFSGIQFWPHLFGLDRTVYDDVITYDWADYFGRGFITAAYDPFKVSQSLELAVDLDGPGPGAIEILVSGDPSVTREFGYSSPLTFYRKHFDPAIGTLKLSGYLTGQLPPYGTPLSFDNIYHLFVQNFNPIAVEPILIYKRRGFVVVNQATFGFDLGQYFLIAGRPYVDTDPLTGAPVAVRWGDFLRCSGGPDSTDCRSILPHTKFSFATFWEESAPAGQDPPLWGSIPDIDRLNPNAVFGPLYQQIDTEDEQVDTPVSLLCPGVFDAVVVEEPITGPWGMGPTSKKRSLVVPCGERGGTDIGLGEGNDTYLYKANPFNDRLHWRFSLADDTPEPTHITVPKDYRVESPDGFVPYGIDVGEVGGDTCPDYLLTFRGQVTVELNPVVGDPFLNGPGDNVVFQVSDEDPRMFADVVQVHFGRMNDAGDDCLINETANLTFGTPGNGKQFATAKFADVNGDGTTDVVVGNLVPEEIPILEGGGFTAYAYVYADANPAAAPQQVRMGFQTDPVGPADVAATAEYIRNLAEAGDDGEGLFGVSALTIDEQGEGSHLGAINGLPLALPPFGCPTKDNIEVASPPDMIWALAQNNQAVSLGLEPALVSTDGATTTLMPSTCHEQHICTIESASGTFEFPFWADDLCCTDPCVDDGAGGVEVREECEAFLCNPEPLIGNAYLCWLIETMPIEMCAVMEADAGGGMPGGGALAMCDDMFSGVGGETIDLDFLDADNVCCIKDCTDSGLEACRTFCVDVDAPGTSMGDLCDLVLACPVAGGPGAKNDDDKAEGDGKTEFAAFRPDEVHH